MKFTLQIELGNAAMKTRADIEEMLHSLDLANMYQQPKNGEYANIRDYCGNTVGKWEITE